MPNPRIDSYAQLDCEQSLYFFYITFDLWAAILNKPVREIKQTSVKDLEVMFSFQLT